MFKNSKHNKKSLINQVKVLTLKDRILNIRDFIVRKAKIIFPIIAIVLILLTVCISLLFQKKSMDTKDEEVIAEVDIEPTVIEELEEENELIVNTNTQVNDLVVEYFEAMKNGDVEAVTLLHNNIIKDTTKIRIQELSKYIESYPSLEIYTKKGPITDSVLVYVYYKVVFIGYDIEVPGMQFMYLKLDENGNYAIYNEAALDLEEVDYIAEVEMEADIIELKNKITVENDEILLDENNGIFAFMAQLTQEVDVKVGQLLAEELQSSEPTGDEETPLEDENEEVVTEPLIAKTTATINVRSSDSLTADAVGKLSSGQTITVYEKQANGWCKIDYEGSEAYVKTDYVHFEESVVGVTVIGSVTATANVNIRSEASTDAQRLGVAVQNQEYDLFEELDEWYKINYDGQMGYVNKEYATKN